jgi:hypothetical protein
VLGHYPSPVRDGQRVPRVLSQLWSRFLPAEERERAREVEEAAAHGGTRPPAEADARHVDWMSSGAGFDDAAFEALMDAVAKGMISSTASSPPGEN